MSTPSMPKSRQRWTTKGSISSKEPGSPRSSTRSRAESFPAACCFLTRSSPPPSRAAWRSASRRFIRSSSDLIGSQRNLLFLREHPLRLTEHLGVVGSRRPYRGGVLLEEPLDLLVQGALAVAIEEEHGLDRAPDLRVRRRGHEPLVAQATREKGRLGRDLDVGESHGREEYRNEVPYNRAPMTTSDDLLTDAPEGIRLVAGT